MITYFSKIKCKRGWHEFGASYGHHSNVCYSNPNSNLLWVMERKSEIARMIMKYYTDYIKKTVVDQLTQPRNKIKEVG